MAIVGGGVAGCTLAALLARGGWDGDITLWEAGRGPGGRTATRRSRSISALRVDHGANLFNISSGPTPTLLPSLLEQGSVAPWTESVALINGAAELRGNDGLDPLLQGSFFRGSPSMDHLCGGLLQLAAGGVQPFFDTLVRYVETSKDRWLLKDSEGRLLTEAENLVLTGTLLAHPRSRLTFGWPVPPMQVLAEELQDPGMNHAMAAVAALRFEARSSLLLWRAAGEAGDWLGLPFRLLSLEPSAQQRWGLWRVSIQPSLEGSVAVVAHSSATFAAEHLGIYGSRSAMARQLGLTASAEQEEEVTQSLAASLTDLLEPWLPKTAVEGGARQLMRWGAAFPQQPGLPLELCWNKSLNLGFCGDFVAGAGFGRVEGAMRSAEQLASRLLGQNS